MPSLELFLMRHGIAEDYNSQRMRGDADRHLTDEGKVKLESQVKGLQKLDLNIGAIVASPYIRAKETADIAARVLGLKVAVAEALVPHAQTTAIMEELEKNRITTPTLIVGHEPHLSDLASLLLSGDTALAIEMKKGALIGFEIETLKKPYRGRLVCLLPPKALRQMA